MRRAAAAQALVELALLLPLLLTLVFATAAVGRLVRVHMALDAVAREAAREATLAPLPKDPNSSADQAAAAATARQMALERGLQVAGDYGLNGLDAAAIQVDDMPFDRGTWVDVTVTYSVGQSDLPFVPFNVGASRAHARQQVDLYRSRGV